MSEENNNKECDLMEVFIEETNDYKNYFLKIKELATNMILNKNCLLDFDDIFIQKNLIKYNNNHCFEILDNNNNYVFPLKSKHHESPYGFGLREQNYFNASQILEKYKDNFEKLLCFYVFFVKILNDDGYNIYYDYIHGIKTLLSDFYEITDDLKVIPKYNIELIEETEKLTKKEPSLREVLNDMYSLKYIEALQKLAKLLKNHKYEYKNLIQNTDNSLFDIEKFLNFVNNYNIRHGDEDTQNGDIKKQKQPTDEQLKVHLDFGLSIYRLFSIYQSENEK